MVDTPASSPPDFETQREPVPRVDTGELDTALAFLDFVRSCLLKKAAGLTEEQLRRAVVPSGTSILGLIQHLTVGERFWFGYQFASIGEDADFDFDMVVPAKRSGAEVLADYRAAIEESNELIRRIGNPEARAVMPVDGEYLSLRLVIAHATGEVTRHAGHADILRELIDGTTGR
ncbi:MAG: DinB family protein [Jatrophihabitantaceae bacterium]